MLKRTASSESGRYDMPTILAAPVAASKHSHYIAGDRVVLYNRNI
jgi:hypothetical protein